MIAIAISIVTLQCLATTIGYAYLCAPKPGVSWEVGDATYNCTVVTNLFGVVMGVISVLSDLFIIFIPIPVIWQLQLVTRKKIGVSIIFLTGIL